MVKKDFFSHDDPYSETDPSDRGGQVGISNPKLAENIAINFGIQYKGGKSVYMRGAGKFSYTPNGKLLPRHTYISLADEFIDQWMHSSGHRANILSKKGLQLGCGTYFKIDKEFNNRVVVKLRNSLIELVEMSTKIRFISTGSINEL